MRYEAIYFDLDGTLWDTTDVTYEGANKVAEKYNLDAVSKEKIDAYIKKALNEFDYLQKGKQKAGKPREKELYN